MYLKHVTNETVGWLQLVTLVSGFAGMGLALGRSSAVVESNYLATEKNAEAIAELTTITRDLTGTAIRSEVELHSLSRRIERLESKQ